MVIRELIESTADSQSVYHDPANQERANRMLDATLLCKQATRHLVDVDDYIGEAMVGRPRLVALLRNLEKVAAIGFAAQLFDALSCPGWEYLQEPSRSYSEQAGGDSA